MDTDQIRARYTTGSYRTKNPDWHDQDAAWKAAHVASLLHCESIVPQSLCDLGCGSGGVLAELKTHLPPQCMLFGYDIASMAIDSASQKHKDTGIVFTSIQSLSDIKKHFDVVLVLDVFEHVQDYIGFLYEVRQLGDLFIFHIPLDIYIQSVWNQELIMTRRRSVNHLHHFCQTTAVDTLRITGYQVRRSQFTASSMATPPYSWRNSIRRRIIRAVFRVWPSRTVALFGGFSLLVLASAVPRPASQGCLHATDQ